VDGQAASVTGSEYLERRDVRCRSRSDAWADGGRGRSWREKFLVEAENALRTRPKDKDAVKDEQIKKLKQKIRDLVLDNDILREALKPYPLDRKTSDA